MIRMREHRVRFPDRSRHLEPNPVPPEDKYNASPSARPSGGLGSDRYRAVRIVPDNGGSGTPQPVSTDISIEQTAPSEKSLSVDRIDCIDSLSSALTCTMLRSTVSHSGARAAHIADRKQQFRLLDGCQTEVNRGRVMLWIKLKSSSRQKISSSAKSNNVLK
jgi:hypothetical protein